MAAFASPSPPYLCRLLPPPPLPYASFYLSSPSPMPASTSLPLPYASFYLSPPPLHPPPPYASLHPPPLPMPASTSPPHLFMPASTNPPPPSLSYMPASTSHAPPPLPMPATTSHTWRLSCRHAGSGRSGRGLSGGSRQHAWPSSTQINGVISLGGYLASLRRRGEGGHRLVIMAMTNTGGISPMT